MFNSEYDYLIHLIRCAIHGTVPENIPDGFSFEKVLEYGRVHEVANIAFLAVQKMQILPDQKIMDSWRQEYWKAVKRDVAQNKARGEILGALHSHGIYTIEVQGTVVKRYYPQSHLRMMSDIDFIVPSDKFDELEGIMQDIGYITEVTHDGKEIDAVKNNVVVELHTEFFDSKRSVYKILNHPFSHTTAYDDFTAVVPDTVFYLFHLLHTIKHAIEYKGIGIRRIVDIYYLENELKDKADFGYIDGVLKENGLYEIKMKLLAVKDHWFNGIESEIDVADFEKEILGAGNHGSHELYFKNKFVNERAEGKHFVKIRYFLSFMFPKKDEIYSAYPFCKKHNYPIVLCWIHRWIFSIFNAKKWKNVKFVISGIFVKSKKNKR